MFHAQIQQVTFVANSMRMHHVKFSNAKWRSDFVLNDLSTHSLSNHLIAIFKLSDPANIDAARTVKLQGSTTRSRFRTTKHHSDFFTDLIDKDHDSFAFSNRTS